MNSDTIMLNGDWMVVEKRVDTTTITSPDNNEDYVFTRFVIRLRRRVSFLTFALTVPCILMTLLTTLVFVVPPQSGEKLSVGKRPF